MWKITLCIVLPSTYLLSSIHSSISPSSTHIFYSCHHDFVLIITTLFLFLDNLVLCTILPHSLLSSPFNTGLPSKFVQRCEPALLFRIPLRRLPSPPPSLRDPLLLHRVVRCTLFIVLVFFNRNGNYIFGFISAGSHSLD